MSEANADGTQHNPTEPMKEILARRVYAVLATTNPDGSPHTTPVWFAFDGNRFVFETDAATRKVHNLKKRPYARSLIQNPPSQPEAWVAAEGPVELIYGEEADRLNELVTDRYLTDEGKRGWASFMEASENVAIVLTPEKWSSWFSADMFKALLDQGRTEEEVARWFLPADS